MSTTTGIRNVRCTVEYDGTEFIGWQRQARGRSVQGEIESVLRRLLQEEVDVIAAGRTDAGVHARGQVINFRTNSRLELRKIIKGLNSLLPGDIVVREGEEVPAEFHARFDARERKYSYLIRREPTALDRHIGWVLSYALDLELMRKAAELVCEQVEFESFCKAGSDVPHHRCAVSRSEWTGDDAGFCYTIQADRFLHGMVRALVGTMVDIGRGATTLEQFRRIFDTRNRSHAGMAAPPQGLILEKVFY
jgi:tRNA pseudouridine38-40 synthase